MFHWRDGWFFARDVDTGDVHVIKRATAADNAPIIAEAWIPAWEWASIVAVVSRSGETGDTFRVVLAVHGDVAKEYAEQHRVKQGRNPSGESKTMVVVNGSPS